VRERKMIEEERCSGLSILFDAGVISEDLIKAASMLLTNSRNRLTAMNATSQQWDEGYKELLAEVAKLAKPQGDAAQETAIQ